MNINTDEHLETLVGSINKMLLNAKNKGIIRNKEITLINLIYKLIKKQAFSNDQSGDEQKLLSIYYKLLNKYSFLCKAPMTRNYYFEQVGINNTYIPNTCLDIPIHKTIYFWQESDINSRIADVFPLINDQGFLLTKQSDTYPVFDLGRDTAQTNIGVICFALTETLYADDYRIYDSLNNDVTQGFTRIYDAGINVILFVSNNIYSNGLMNLKIKKLTTIYGVFDDVFNNIFD